MSYSPPGIRELGLPAHVESLRETSNGHGWLFLSECFDRGLSDTAIGKLFNKHRKTIGGWRKHYKTGDFNNERAV